jgi:uncharacterized membrane protein
MNDPLQETGRGEQPPFRSEPSATAPASRFDGAEPPYTAPYPPYPYDLPPTGAVTPSVASALSYAVVPGILFLVAEPYRRSSLVRFHAWQGIFYFIAFAAARAIEMLISSMLPSAVALTLGSLLLLLFLAGWLIAIVKALQGERYHLPLVGGYADRTAAESSVRR